MKQEFLRALFFWRHWSPTSGSWVGMLVVAVLVTSAIAVSYSVHKSRYYLNQLQSLESERDQLEVQWSQLLLEEHAWGAYTRVGTVATEQLQMRNPSPQEIIMVRR